MHRAKVNREGPQGTGARPDTRTVPISRSDVNQLESQAIRWHRFTPFETSSFRLWRRLSLERSRVGELDLGLLVLGESRLVLADQHRLDQR